MLIGVLLALVLGGSIAGVFAPPAAFADEPAPAPSDSPSAAPAPIPATPQPVQNPRWQGLSATTVRLSWDAPSDAADGTVYTAVAHVSGTGGGETGAGAGQVLTVRTASTSTVFTGVLPGSVLVPQVGDDARLAAGFIDVGPTWTQPPVAASAPRTVRLALVLPGGVPGLRVSWAVPASDGGTPVTGYRVRVTRSGAEVSSAERTVAAGTRSVTFADVDPGTGYLSTVVAITRVGDGTAAGSNLVDTGGTPSPSAIGGGGFTPVGIGSGGAAPGGTVPAGTVASAPAASNRAGSGTSGMNASGVDAAQVAAPRVQAEAAPFFAALASLPVLGLLGSVFAILLAGSVAILLVVRRFGL